MLEGKQVLCRKRYERMMINDPRARFIAVILRGEKTEEKSEAHNEELRSHFGVGLQDKTRVSQS